MLDILTRAGCFVAIIALGYILRRTGFFGPETFGLLSRIVMKITLPAAILASAAGRPIDTGMLTLALLGLGTGVLYMGIGWLVSCRNTRQRKAYYIQNLPGYNVGTFALPFTQSFLGPVGVLTSSIFDLGNAFISFGGAFSVARAVKEGSKADFRRVLAAPLTSLPFLTHVVMAVLNLNHLTLPRVILSFAEILGGANAFLAMLMIGTGLNLDIDRSKLGIMAKVLLLRFGTAAILALCCYRLLPFGLEVRQTLVILLFSPFTSTVPVYTAQLKEDVGLASALNSVSIVASIVIIVTLLTVML